ncbi:hypothetical protein OpiT1DRAFT_04759 [Opitutaceae bacterium TAV1]|nr:hypothetical protein OpiT1DRAFT_04759 [Opitutaceae bacterium TAV1]
MKPSKPTTKLIEKIKRMSPAKKAELQRDTERLAEALDRMDTARAQAAQFPRTNYEQIVIVPQSLYIEVGTDGITLWIWNPVHETWCPAIVKRATANAFGHLLLGL